MSQTETVTSQARDRLVTGIRDRHLKGKLQLQSDMTSQKAITMARQTGEIKQQMKAQTRQFERLDKNTEIVDTRPEQKGVCKLGGSCL